MQTKYPTISQKKFAEIIANNPIDTGLIYLENLIAEGNNNYFADGGKVTDFLTSGKICEYLKAKFNGGYSLNIQVGYIIVKPNNSSKQYYIGNEPQPKINPEAQNYQRLLML